MYYKGTMLLPLSFILLAVSRSSFLNNKLAEFPQLRATWCRPLGVIGTVICNSFRREARVDCLYVVHISTLTRKLLKRFKNVTEIIMASDRAEKKLLGYSGLKLEKEHLLRYDTNSSDDEPFDAIIT